MTTKTTNRAATDMVAADPLAIFATQPSEKEGVMVDIEHPKTGDVLMRFRVGRFGGSNSAKMVRVERELKSKLTSGERRKIDAGGGDPDVVLRLNRQIFVRVCILGFEPVDPALRERYPAQEGAAAFPVVDELLQAYPKMYDVLTELATDEEKYAAAELQDDEKN